MTKLEPGDLTGKFPTYPEWLDTVAHPLDHECRTQQIYNYAICKYLIANRLQPKVIVEIGVRLGYSAHAFLSACPEATFVGLDLPGGGSGGTKVAGLDYVRELWGKHFPKAMVTLFAVNTQLLTEYKGPKPDLFHVDGDHSFAGALHDIKLAWASGATHILVDDYTFLPAVHRAVHDFISANPVEAEFFDTVRGDALLRHK